MTDWQIYDQLGEVAAFHATEPQPVRSATFVVVAEPTLVLGSAQRDRDVDHAVASALRIHVVPRRSGGGAVLLLPGEFLWLDLVIPSDDPLWAQDVGVAMLWVGELWRRALADVGVATTVSTRPDNTREWSRQICFAGIGHGEVVIGTGKVVGISQRRTRAFARFQSMCHLRWHPELVAALVAAPRPHAADIANAAVSVPATYDALRASLISSLVAIA